MNMLVAIHVVLHIILGVLVGGLLVLYRQPLAWRIVLGVIHFGVLWNLAGLFWLGYAAIWPGEPVITGGFCLAFFAWIFYKQPLVTRKAGA